MSDIESTAMALHRLAEEIRTNFRADQDRAKHREEVIDRLFAENRALRLGLLEEALTPVRAGLYRLYDLADREAGRLRSAPEDGGHLSSLMEAIAAEVAEVLARTGAELLEVAAGEPYDPSKHRAVRTEPGPDGRVVSVVGAGFYQGERTLRKADVVIGKAESTAEDEREDG